MLLHLIHVEKFLYYSPIESVIPQFQRMFPELTINYMPTATNNPIIMVSYV